MMRVPGIILFLMFMINGRSALLDNQLKRINDRLNSMEDNFITETRTLENRIISETRSLRDDVALIFANLQAFEKQMNSSLSKLTSNEIERYPPSNWMNGSTLEVQTLLNQIRSLERNTSMNHIGIEKQSMAMEELKTIVAANTKNIDRFSEGIDTLVDQTSTISNEFKLITLKLDTLSKYQLLLKQDLNSKFDYLSKEQNKLKTELREQLQNEISELRTDLSEHREDVSKLCFKEEVTAKSCMEVKNQGHSKSGVYKIQLGSQKKVSVYCDMATNGGGWTIFQRRQDGSVNFYREWLDYKHGFGDISGEFWLGNDVLHELTANGDQQLRMDLWDWEGNYRYALYNSFIVDSEPSKYKLTIGGYSGNANDAMISEHNGMYFSTKDKDNDRYGTSCATKFKGAWWYQNCHYANLNGPYLRGKHSSYADGINWYQWHGYYYSLKKTEMKIRPTQ